MLGPAELDDGETAAPYGRQWRRLVHGVTGDRDSAAEWADSVLRRRPCALLRGPVAVVAAGEPGGEGPAHLREQGGRGVGLDLDDVEPVGVERQEAVLHGGAGGL